MTKLSHSRIKLYTECPRKFFYHYVQNYKAKEYKAFFLFGSAIDYGLNTLLETKDIEKAIKAFDKSFRYNFINNVGTYIPTAMNVVYAEADFDKDLLKEEDIDQYVNLRIKLNVNLLCINQDDIRNELNSILERKANKGFRNLSNEDKQLYSMANWLSLRRKGHIMIESYNKKIVSKIKEVIAIQAKTSLKNAKGDALDGILDLIVKWEDGKTYLMDNKTSAREYKQDAASVSQQLIIYYKSAKKDYNLDGIGFFVMYKNILKNKVKICSKCGKNGSGQRHKTCDAVVNPYTDKDLENMNKVGTIIEMKETRCNGIWIETIDPECDIDVIFDIVSESAENLVMETVTGANEGIKNEIYKPNLNACGTGEFRCQFFNKCWKGSEEDIIKVENKK